MSYTTINPLLLFVYFLTEHSSGIQCMILTLLQEYQVADDHLKSSLPPVVTAAFSILPHLLAAQIMTQNTLLAQSYTLLHDFCDGEGFPDPPPSANAIISNWDVLFRPVKQDLESISCIAGGKTVRTSMRIEEKPHGSVTGLNIRNGISSQRHSSQPRIEDKPHNSMSGPAVRNGIPAQRRSSGNQSNALMPPSPAMSATSDPPSPDYRENPRPRIASVPSQTSLGLATPNYNSSAVASPPPGDPAMHAPAGPRGDYFNRDRLPSNSSMASIVAGKKKPPPPPPKKIPSTQGTWVTALYEFGGQGHGDLVFREGDRIKVTKKTESMDDWWEGELNGVQGSFPANYCQLV